MRLPAYVLLPILGAVALAAAVLGSWLWPAPTAPAPSPAPLAVPAPVVTEAPMPSPAPRPPPLRPAARPPVANLAPVVAQPQSGAVGPTQPLDAVPPPPVTLSPLADMGPDARRDLQQKWSSLRGRAAEIAMKGVQELERQRAEAQARGDQAEVERLDAIIPQQRERVERMRALQVQTPSARPELPPPEQAGPPLE